LSRAQRRMRRLVHAPRGLTNLPRANVGFAVITLFKSAENSGDCLTEGQSREAKLTHELLSTRSTPANERNESMFKSHLIQFTAVGIAAASLTTTGCRELPGSPEAQGATIGGVGGAAAGAAIGGGHIIG
jgi:hypothetical protein